MGGSFEEIHKCDIDWTACAIGLAKKLNDNCYDINTEILDLAGEEATQTVYKSTVMQIDGCMQ